MAKPSPLYLAMDDLDQAAHSFNVRFRVLQMLAGARGHHPSDVVDDVFAGLHELWSDWERVQAAIQAVADAPEEVDDA